jgi:uncharacterized protein YhhL (DUF1145 family)
MFNAIDIRILFTFTVLMTLAQLLILIHTWRSRKTYPGFGSWIWALVFTLVGVPNCMVES